MLDHGQLGPPTPAIALSPVSSRRPSTHDTVARRPSSTSSRRLSGGALSMTAMARPRLGSTSGLSRPSPLTPVEGSNGLAGQVGLLSMSALEDDEIKSLSLESDLLTSSTSQSQNRRSSSFGTDLRSRLLAGLSLGPSSLSMSALDSDDDESADSTPTTMSTHRTDGAHTTDTTPSSLATETIIGDPDSVPIANKGRPLPASSTAAPGVSTLQHGAELSAQLHSNPKLATLRSPGGLSMTPLQTTTRVIDKASISPPILMNPKCSGHFVEPVGRIVLCKKLLVLISSDEMDGFFLRGWTTGGEDNLPK
jgi:dual specificity phosphatase 12